MDVRLVFLRQIIVDHVGDTVHVDSARRNVRRHENTHLAVAEVLQCARSLQLRLVAVDRLGSDLVFVKTLHHLVRAVPGTREDQHLVILRMGLQQIGEQTPLVAPIHKHQALVDTVNRRRLWRNGDRHGILDQGCRQSPNLAIQGSGEELRMPLFGQMRDNLLDVRQKPHVQHPVGLIQNELLNQVEENVFLFHQVEETSRRGDHDVGAILQRPYLRILAHAAKNHGVPDVDELAVIGTTLRNLGGEFTRRSQNQRTGMLGNRVFRIRQQPVQNREQERGGFARSRLRSAQQVFSRQQNGNRLLLNRSRIQIPNFGNRVLQQRIQLPKGVIRKSCGDFALRDRHLARFVMFRKSGVTITLPPKRTATSVSPSVEFICVHKGE